MLTGEFKPGDKVPSTAQLCERYGVSNLTTQRALNILKKQGFVRGESGVGVFVTANQPIAVEANHYPGRRTDRSHRDDQKPPTGARPDTSCPDQTKPNLTALPRHLPDRHRGSGVGHGELRLANRSMRTTDNRSPLPETTGYATISTSTCR
ncbi:GntR family transcriptional regulator [Solwaraspora sp. WMMA2065]|uniref:GntR family transcriptional regulator n=1 Tax=Solwaraspora sp. WMMA2065 TaxID=3015166 RepID=UPI00259B8735|nr:GntR family transcriptional regulator [Solwaraspora sp. WMMA2065]WJK37749.1 GntR family transcriptional regulator [Solwaraspora sp. WMMA2065]